MHHGQNSSFLELDYIGSSTNNKLEFENNCQYKDPRGKIQGLLVLVQLDKRNEYFPVDFRYLEFIVEKNILPELILVAKKFSYRLAMIFLQHK